MKLLETCVYYRKSIEKPVKIMGKVLETWANYQESIGNLWKILTKTLANLTCYLCLPFPPIA
jgi:hypothetical protein